MTAMKVGLETLNANSNANTVNRGGNRANMVVFCLISSVSLKADEW